MSNNLVTVFLCYALAFIIVKSNGQNTQYYPIKSTSHNLQQIVQPSSHGNYQHTLGISPQYNEDLQKDQPVQPVGQQQYTAEHQLPEDTLFQQNAQKKPIVVQRINVASPVSPLTTAVNGFAQRFMLEAVQMVQSQNLIIAPFTIYTLMMLLAEGAEGDSFEQLRNALGIESLIKSRNQYTELYKILSNSSSNDVSLTSFSALVTDQNRPVNAEYESIVEQGYKGDVFPVNFPDLQSTYEKINSYALEKTNGEYARIVGIDDIMKAQLILLSGLTFKGRWQQVFNVSNTKVEDFYSANGSILGQVNMMYQMGGFPYTANVDLQSHLLELPYGKDGHLSMVIALPRKGISFDEVLQRLSIHGFERALEDLRVAATEYDDEVEVRIPRFQIKCSFKLNAVLYNMGIVDIFQSNANLIKISASNQYSISSVIHKAKIEVDESGTTASSISAAILSNKSTPPKFTANRPFLYFIVHKSSNLILFSGVYQSPALY